MIWEKILIEVIIFIIYWIFGVKVLTNFYSAYHQTKLILQQKWGLMKFHNEFQWIRWVLVSMDDLIEIKNNNKTGMSHRGDWGVWDVKEKIKMQDSVKLKMLILY